MGFYSPATLVQEGKRRGLAFLPPCVVASDWPCTVVDDDTIRLGLLGVRGLREETVLAMLGERVRRPFSDLGDFRRRTRFNREEMTRLAAVGALRELAPTRRRALWEVATTVVREDDLFSSPSVREPATGSPLPEMSYPERLHADYDGLGLTTGKHPMALARPRLSPGILPATTLTNLPDGVRATAAGAVICRQRPGTAKGVVFITLEDETGLANAIVYADVFERYRLVITTEPFLLIEGRIQRDGEGTTHLMAAHLEPLAIGDGLPAASSHDFH
jgi:error-prone DNA polymerase